MTPNIGNMEIPAMAAMEAGADGIAAINTIKSIMNVNLDTFAIRPRGEVGKTSVGGYSGKAVKPIALRFIHAMKDCPELSAAPISGMGGIETWRDAAEFMALGCENLADNYRRHAVRLPHNRRFDRRYEAIFGTDGR